MKRRTWGVPAAVSFLSAFVAAAGPVRAEGLSLRDAVNRALTRNPLVSEERIGVEAGSQGILSARGLRLPRLSLDLDYTQRQDPVPFIPAQSVTAPAHFSDEFASWGVLLTLPLYQGGRISNRVKLATVRRDLQEDSLARTRDDLIANTVNSDNKILQPIALREASSASVTALEEQIGRTRLLLDVGRIARVDLLKVEGQLANERQRLLTFDEGIATAGATLRYLMGESPGGEAGSPPLSDNLVLQAAPSDTASGLIDAARKRPEYLAAVKGVEEAELSRRRNTENETHRHLGPGGGGPDRRRNRARQEEAGGDRPPGEAAGPPASRRSRTGGRGNARCHRPLPRQHRSVYKKRSLFPDFRQHPRHREA